VNVPFICYCCCMDVATLDRTVINYDFPSPLSLTSVPVAEVMSVQYLQAKTVVVLLVCEIESLE